MNYVRRLRWDAWNIEHIARHGIRPFEVEETVAGVTLTIDSYKGRVLVVGQTQAGELLSMVLAPEGEGIFYTVTARPAGRRERRLYREILAGDTR